MPARGMPAASSVRSTGGRISLFGTGRVMSQTTTHAVFLPFASSASGFEPMGLASAASSAASGFGQRVRGADGQRRRDEAVVRQRDGQAGLAVVEGELHSSVSVSVGVSEKHGRSVRLAGRRRHL